MNIHDFNFKKKRQEKITMLTCYDYSSARILANTDIDCLLVGDSLGMTMHGFKDTLPVTIEMMQLHTAAVSRGAHNKFIISDMPFISYRKSLNSSVNAASKLMQSGANAVKLEGAAGNLKLIQHLVESGIPVMGHLGLTPQSVHVIGGYKVQGKSIETAQKLQQDTIDLQDAGCFSIVLECIPAQLATEITHHLTIPTIGIGAGPGTDGQVLVWQDLLGLNIDFKPKFVNQFCQGHELFKSGIHHFIESVKSREFPQHEHCY